MPKFNFDQTPVRKVAEDIRDNHDTPSAGAAIPDGANSPTSDPTPLPEVPSSEAVPRSQSPEVLKNVGAKIPYSVYDRLERIKRQSERSGVKADKRNIGDLIAQAIKEFVERYDV